MAEYGKCFSNLKRNAAISLAFNVGQTVILVAIYEGDPPPFKYAVFRGWG